MRAQGDLAIDAGADNDEELANHLRFIAGVGVFALQGRLEFADPVSPAFYRDGDDRLNYGHHNLDNIYMHAELDGSGTYHLHGEPGGREFNVATSGGDSSEVKREQRLGERWSQEIRMNVDGTFDMMLSADEQPGNWLPLRAGASCVVGIRQYFVDWSDYNIPGFFYVNRMDGPVGTRPFTAERLTIQLNDASDRLERTVQFWMNYGGLRNLRPETTNAVPRPSVISLSTSNVAYGIGHFVLQPDQALLIQFQPPPTRYWGFNIYNWSGGASAFQNRVSSLNWKQAHVDSDNQVRIVVSDRDVGHPNWLDTAGTRRGVVWLRWLVFQGEAPAPISKVVAASQLWNYVPEDTPRVGTVDRRHQLHTRRSHLARRFQR